MRVLVALLLTSILLSPAAAESRRKQCVQACGPLVDACAAMSTALGFGDLRHGCRQGILKRCKREGPAACALVCGDGRRQPSEVCDGSDVGESSCASVGFLGGTLACTASCVLDTSGCTAAAFPASGQTMSVTAGDDGAFRRGAPLRYVDHGDGTLSDVNTGLMWEKKSFDGGLHDKDFHHTWEGPVSVFGWVDELNAGGGFAGHTDWRVPNVRELQSIVDYSHDTHSVADAFNTGCTAGCTILTCSCTEPAAVWTSTTFVSDPTYAWVVDFANGFVGNQLKTTPIHVRAVRGP